jgi:hypothetical protein
MLSAAARVWFFNISSVTLSIGIRFLPASQDQVADTIYPTVKISQDNRRRVILADDCRTAEPVTGRKVLSVINCRLVPAAVQPDPGLACGFGHARFFRRYRQVRFRHATGNHKPQIDNLDGGIRI